METQVHDCCYTNLVYSRKIKSVIAAGPPEVMVFRCSVCQDEFYVTGPFKPDMVVE